VDGSDAVVQGVADYRSSGSEEVAAVGFRRHRTDGRGTTRQRRRGPGVGLIWEPTGPDV